jgi:hypothetical protein
MTIEARIRDALRHRRALTLLYKDGDPRTVHPHVLFPSTDGTVFLDCYQVAGHTSAGTPLPAWKQFKLAQIRELEPNGHRFELAPGYNPSSPKYANALVFVR